MSTSDTFPSATPLTWPIAALITCIEDGNRHKFSETYILASLPSSDAVTFVSEEFGNHLSCRVSLCNGIDAKQAGVRVWGIEGCGLKDSQRSSDIRRQTLCIYYWCDTLSYNKNTMRKNVFYLLPFLFWTYIKGLCSGFGDTLAQFAGDVWAPLYMWPSSQDPLQHAKGISLCTTRHTTLAGNKWVYEGVVVLHTQLTYTQTHTIAPWQ